FHHVVGADPTRGHVTYVSKKVANQQGLFNANGRLITKLGNDGKAISVRLESNVSYWHGHIITFQAGHIPTGLGMWPAFWMLGENKKVAPWPVDGEIDIMEATNTDTVNHQTLHTEEGCVFDTSALSEMVGQLSNGVTSCQGSTGCGATTRPDTIGAAFNQRGGGVWAMQWDESVIKMWQFGSEGRADINANKPDPSKWGKPDSVFKLSQRCRDVLRPMRIVINTTVCGDWAGATFPGGPAECIKYVSQADAYKEAYWDMKSLKIFR
ncbi:hypothetical protein CAUPRSCDRAFT_2690, partial [Caulochytrium protostelioides]